MGLVVGVDGSADFGDPQGYAEVDEEGEGRAELVAVEGALGLADDDGVEAALRVADYLEESGGLGARFQGRTRERPGVEVLGNDLAAGGFDEGADAGELPVAGGLGVLAVFGGAASGECEVNYGPLALWA
ncbi:MULTISPECIES: hypothetical protein [Streptomyces]|uniref:Uncharacterized protein n=1 Tax=Streptomyces siderophoricus TaxID=2802281 RepID=A0ABS1MT56_9ACTN|nr:hypothetical protein [Streptomyces sp. 9-7]MBL1090965.1 hypothetical protein [Streptomyces sp. 9-7]